MFWETKQKSLACEHGFQQKISGELGEGGRKKELGCPAGVKGCVKEGELFFFLSGNRKVP